VRRIAIVIPTLDRMGGAERQAMLLAKGLTRRGWHVAAIALSGSGGAAEEELCEAGVEFVSLRMRKGLADVRGWWLLHRWLVRNRPDVLHAHMPHAAWMARWSRLFAPECVVVDTIHTSAIGTRGRQLGYRWSDWLTDQVTAVSEGAAEAYGSAGMVSAQHLATLPNGIDTKHWQPDPAMRATMRERLGVTDEFLWVAAGRLAPVKDYPTLLRALKMLQEPLQLAIAGDGSMDGPLRRLAYELRVEHRVQFLGFKEDMREWMQAADGVALASRWEGLPMALLEAGACGVPAVATDVAGSRETIVHGETGLLAKAGDTEAFAGAMKELMDTPAETRRKIGERARQLVTERYGIDSILDRWEALYEELLRRRVKRTVSIRHAPVLRSRGVDAAAENASGAVRP